ASLGAADASSSAALVRVWRMRSSGVRASTRIAARVWRARSGASAAIIRSTASSVNCAASAGAPRRACCSRDSMVLSCCNCSSWSGVMSGRCGAGPAQDVRRASRAAVASSEIGVGQEAGECGRQKMRMCLVDAGEWWSQTGKLNTDAPGGQHGQHPDGRPCVILRALSLFQILPAPVSNKQSPTPDRPYLIASTRASVMPDTPQTSTLYIVATPIGNLGDMSARAIDTLRSVDVVAAEDTRHSGRLLQHFGINTRMLSYHDFSDDARVQMIIDRLRKGESVALISDAGTPLISDPGYRLVMLAREAGVPVVPVPGACALTTALCASGLPSDRFMFEGFLPARHTARVKHLEALRDETHT